MNVWRIAVFVFLLQTGVTLVSLANFPIACTSDSTTCLYFNADTMRGTDMGAIITDTVDTSKFESTQITTNIFATDAFTFATTALGLIVDFIYMSVFGIATFILFAFGSNAVSIAFASAMQVVVYFFYGRLLADVIRPGSRGEA